jgi:hypothetical protein
VSTARGPDTGVVAFWLESTTHALRSEPACHLPQHFSAIQSLCKTWAREGGALASFLISGIRVLARLTRSCLFGSVVAQAVLEPADLSEPAPGAHGLAPSCTGTRLP